MIPAFFRLECHDQLGSTNDVAKQAAEAGAAEGLVVQALRQTAGRGRLGRSWSSPEGNLYISVLLRPACAAQEAGHYSFVAALAVYEAIATTRGEDGVAFKWPNDVLIHGKKVSGVLIETGLRADGSVDWLVIGVGVNVSAAPKDTPYPATSLWDEGATTRVEAVRDAFLSGLHHWSQTLRRDGFDPVRRGWLADAQRGPLTVRTQDGETHGTFAGLDEKGGLILRLADGGERVIYVGDVLRG